MAYTDSQKRAIGKNVVALRKARGWNQRDLATASTTSPATLSKIENGKAADDPYSMRRIADAFGVALVDLEERGAASRLRAQGEPARYSKEWFVRYRARAERLDEPLRSQTLRDADDAERFLDRLPEFDQV